MKRYILNTIMTGVIAIVFASCKEEDFSSKEYYKYVVYLLSKEDYNVYSDVYPFDDGNEVEGYFSVGCGGSLANPEETTVELEADTVLMSTYNRANFDIDTSKFALLLPESRYRIDPMRVVIPANNKDQYVKVPVIIYLDGLSPDSTYFIPLAIKNVSRYEVNPEKYNMLFRVLLENRFAELKTTTYYSMRGNTLDAAMEAVVGGAISGTKLARPISKNAVRIFAGMGPVKADFGIDPVLARPSTDELDKYGIVLTVDENDSVSIAPCGTIQVEQINGDQWNTYEEARNNMVDETVTKYFYLRYRYRTLKTPPSTYDNWITVQETLKRLEN
ncbi:MAG: DUF4361 domain-containing protein [Bacteroidales bacterium]|jgi:hypothetical protein|nr:DUF4361 domain-containing protein [Bacteroidales bacterium]